jgi:hypothetical protein
MKFWIDSISLDRECFRLYPSLLKKCVDILVKHVYPHRDECSGRGVVAGERYIVHPQAAFFQLRGMEDAHKLLHFSVSVFRCGTGTAREETLCLIEEDMTGTVEDRFKSLDPDIMEHRDGIRREDWMRYIISERLVYHA